METVGVPYHLDQFIPGFDVGVAVNTEIRVDPDEAKLLAGSQIERRGLDLTAADLPEGDLHLHVDVDICDPELVPDLLFPAPGCLPLADVLAAVRRIMATGRAVAVDLAATWHHNGPFASVQCAVMPQIAAAVKDPDRTTATDAGCP